jgi:hypothetical protein
MGLFAERGEDKVKQGAILRTLSGSEVFFWEEKII